MAPIIIAHRGNLYGPNKVEENRPETIINAVQMGFNCEIDVWYLKSENCFYLGHDFPMYPVEFAFLENYKNFLWIHCKNLDALIYLKDSFNCFFHDRDHYTITSKGIIWGNINSPMSSRVVCVMPELSHTISFDVFGICTDFAVHFRDLIKGVS